MKSFLPDISSRSYTPMSTRNLDSKFKPPLAPSQLKSVRNISVGPLSTRSSRHSSDYFIKPRAASDSASFALENESFLGRMQTSFSNKSNRLKPMARIVQQSKNFSNAVQALFDMYPSEKGRVGACALANLFVSIGLSEKPEQVCDILQGISEGLTIDVISYSKHDLMKIFEDGKTDYILREILKDFNFNSGYKLSGMLQVLRRWWTKLDKSQNGFVPVDEIIKFLADIKAVESSSDIKRMYLKMGQYGNFKQFSSVFSKSLLKFLLSELSGIIDQGGNKFVSADITIMEMRRKMILENLDTRGKILTTS